MVQDGYAEHAPSESQPTLGDLRDHYDDWNERYRRGGFNEIDPEIRLRGERLLEHLISADLSVAEILEVGCGTGWMAERLVDLGSVTGIDLSPRAIAIARARGLDAEFIAGDLLELNLGDRQFDAVVCMETLFYVPDQRSFVERIAQLTRPGGILALSFINKCVYERRSDVGPPPRGQIRSWLSARQVRGLIAPWFRVESAETVGPRGDQGILRITESFKVNLVLGRLFGRPRLARLKERLRLGGGYVLLARRRAE